MAIGKLRFHDADYGGGITSSGILQSFLMAGPDKEANQCATVASAAGLDWGLQNRPRRFHNSTKVISLAARLRLLELTAAKDAPHPREKQAVWSAAHYSTCAGNDRDVRVLQRFLLPIANTYVAFDIRISEISSNCASTVVHVFCVPESYDVIPRVTFCRASRTSRLG